MKAFKKLVALTSFIALVATPLSSIHAADYVYDAGGCGYQQCRKAPCIAPAIALGTIALVAIIAVAVQNQDSGDSHDHCHCD